MGEVLPVKRQFHRSAGETHTEQCATIGGMSRVVHLHIGAPKTGTTYLQHRLARNVKTCLLYTSPSPRDRS